MDDIKKIAAETLKQAGLHEKTIDGQKYKIKLLPATQSLAIATTLMKLVLPSLGAYADGMRAKEFTLPEELTTFTEISSLLVRQMDNVSVIDLVNLLLSEVTKDGLPIDHNEEFRGKLGGYVSLIEFALMENCGDFFTGYLKEKGIDLPTLSQPVSQE